MVFDKTLFYVILHKSFLSLIFFLTILMHVLSDLDLLLLHLLLFYNPFFLSFKPFYINLSLSVMELHIYHIVPRPMPKDLSLFFCLFSYLHKS